MSIRAVTVEAYREGVSALGASMVGGLLAGVVLGGMRAEFSEIPGLLVLVPALLATRGNVYGSLGARVATALHQGLIVPSLTEYDDRLLSAIVAAIANGLVASAFAAVATFAFLMALSQPTASVATLLTVAILAGILSGLTLSGIVVGVVFAGYRRGYNPDTLVGPIVTTTGDVFGMSFLFLSVEVVLAL